MFDDIYDKNNIPVEIEELAKILFENSQGKYKAVAKKMLQEEPWKIIGKFKLPYGEFVPSTNGTKLREGFILEAVHDPSRKAIFSKKNVYNAFKYNTIFNHDTFTYAPSVRKHPGRKYGMYMKKSRKWDDPQRPGLRTLENYFNIDIDERGPVMPHLKKLVDVRAFEEPIPRKHKAFSYKWDTLNRNQTIIEGLSKFLEE